MANEVYYEVEKRDVAISVLLSIITFGIYYIVWRVKQTEEINDISDGELDISPIGVVLLGFITCGLFYAYYDYKACAVLKKAGLAKNDDDIICIILDIVLTSLASAAILQIRLNTVATDYDKEEN